jgi:GNAT superfamily N-acetyltransferase
VRSQGPRTGVPPLPPSCSYSADVDIDERLVRRLETSAASATSHLVEGLRTADRTHPAVWRALHDGALIAMGPGRYVNRGMGVTIDELTSAEIDDLEAFYTEHASPPALEVSSWAHPATLAELTRRAYTPAWFRSVFAMPLVGPARPATGHSPDVHIEPVGADGLEVWLDVSATGFGVADGDARAVSDELARATHATPDAHPFLAFVGGVVAGCGTLQVLDGVAWLGAAATLPRWRGHGVQTALVWHRLRLADRLGCELAAVTAVPAGPSARNLRHLGFQHVDTQVVLTRV